MAYEKQTWEDRQVENPLTFTQQNNLDGSVTLTPYPGAIQSEGSKMSAERFNHMEEGIYTANKLLDDLINVRLSGTIVYENEQGSDDNITLTQTIENTKRIKIEYYIMHGGKQYNVVEVFNPQNKVMTLGGVIKDNSQDVLFIGGKVIKIKNDTINNIKTDRATVASMEINTINQWQVSQIPVNITKVVAYDY